jgi:hypothetical protein
MSLLRRIEKSLDQRLRGIFGGSHKEPGAREAIELYRDALDQIAARATVGKRGDRMFPFNLINIELMAADPERKAVLETLFDPGQLGDDVRSTLAEERMAAPANLTVAVHYPEDAATEMRIVCEKTEQVAAPAATTELQAIPQAPLTRVILVTLAGVPSSQHFIADRPHINIGREDEVVDSAGRAIRRNDLFFPEAAHEANGSVSRSHAHMRFDFVTGEWRIYDDGSSLGTGIFREGRRIEVPSHAARGVLLRPGDEICLGQVRVRFEV